MTLWIGMCCFSKIFVLGLHFPLNFIWTFSREKYFMDFVNSKFLSTDRKMMRKGNLNIFNIGITIHGYFYIHKIQNFGNVTGWPERYIRHWFCCNNCIIMAFFIGPRTPSIEPLPWPVSVKIHETSILFLSANFLARKAQPAFLYWLDGLSVIRYKFQVYNI